MSTTSKSVIHVGSTEAFQQAIEQTALTVVDFWATWCPPCKAYSPVVDAYAEAAPEGVQVLKVNVDDHQEIARKYGIRSIPTSIFFRSGEEESRVSGALSQQQLAAEVQKHL